MISVKVGPEVAVIRGGYDVRDVIKHLGGRWDKTTKTWVIAAFEVPRLLADIRYAGYRVEVTREQAAPPPRQERASRGTWADSLFEACPEHLCEPVFKALLRVLHPDIGGDTVLAQQLNDARSRRHADVA